MSGVVTGSTPTTMRSHPSGIHKDRKKAREKRRAEDLGGTTSKSHDVRRVPASRRNSNTLIMAFGSSAVGRAESTLAGITDAIGMAEAYEVPGLSLHLSRNGAVNHRLQQALVLAFRDWMNCWLA